VSAVLTGRLEHRATGQQGLIGLPLLVRPPHPLLGCSKEELLSHATHTHTTEGGQ
jgi:hypothetical protein